jgi:hypothetical protein
MTGRHKGKWEISLNLKIDGSASRNGRFITGKNPPMSFEEEVG